MNFACAETNPARSGWHYSLNLSASVANTTKTRPTVMPLAPFQIRSFHFSISVVRGIENFDKGIPLGPPCSRESENYVPFEIGLGEDLKKVEHLQYYPF